MDLTDFSKGQAWSILPEKFEALARNFQQFQESKNPVKEINPCRGSDIDTMTIQAYRRALRQSAGSILLNRL